MAKWTSGRRPFGILTTVSLFSPTLSGVIHIVASVDDRHAKDFTVSGGCWDSVSPGLLKAHGQALLSHQLNLQSSSFVCVCVICVCLFFLHMCASAQGV